MFDFEGNMSGSSRRLNHQVMFEDEDDEMTDLASTMASVSANDWESNIDSNVSTAFSVPLSIEQRLSPSSNVAFFKDINLREEISKISASIGSCNVSSETCSVFDIDKPSFSK